MACSDTQPQPPSPVHLSPCSSTALSPDPSHPEPSDIEPSQWTPVERDRISNDCGCNQELIALEKERFQLEKEKLQVKREELQQRERHHQEIILLKKAKLNLLAKHLTLAETQFNGHFSMPVISLSENGELLNAV